MKESNPWTDYITSGRRFAAPSATNWCWHWRRSRNDLIRSSLSSRVRAAIAGQRGRRVIKEILSTLGFILLYVAFGVAVGYTLHGCQPEETQPAHTTLWEF